MCSILLFFQIAEEMKAIIRSNVNHRRAMKNKRALKIRDASQLVRVEDSSVPTGGRLKYTHRPNMRTIDVISKAESQSRLMVTYQLAANASWNKKLSAPKLNVISPSLTYSTYNTKLPNSK